MRQNKWFRRAAGISLVCASVVSIAPFGGSSVPVASAQAAVDPDPGGEFHALTPTRILDTRVNINDVAPLGKKRLVTNPTTSSAGEFRFNPLGEGGLPTTASDVLAVVANVTVTNASVGGWVATYPTGFDFGGADGTEQTSSLVNFAAGNSVPNLVIVGLDSSGSLTINAGGSVAGNYDVIIDVLGFISTSSYGTAGARLELVDPGRVVDTRKTARIGAGKSLAVKMWGIDTIVDDANSPIRQDIVPDSSSVKAVLVNLTLVSDPVTGQRTHVSATPNVIDPTKFYASSSNVVPGGRKANTTVVPVSDDGFIQLYNAHGNLDVVVDVLGYFVSYPEAGIDTSGNRGRIVPLEAPFRAFDTRGDGKLQHGSQEEWSFDNFVNSVVLNPDSKPTPAPPQQGLIGSLVAIRLDPLYVSETSGRSWLRLAPANGSPAEISNVNFSLNEVVANMSLVKYGTSGSDSHVVEAYNRYGQIDYLLDVYAIVLDN